MSVYITHHLPDMPVIIATLTDHITHADALEIYQRSAEIMGDSPQKVFRIANVLEATSTFHEMLRIIQEASQGQPGSTTDPRVETIFVGNNEWVEMMRNAMQLQQFGAKCLPMFYSEQDALEYISMELERV